MKTSIIIPTFHRAEQLRRNTERLFQTVAGLDVEVVIVVEEDASALDAVKHLPVVTTYHADWRGSMANWNIGAGMATGDLFVLGADDIWWGDNWLHNAIEHMAQAGTCYTGLNDKMWNGWTDNVTHWAITRDGIVRYCGGCLMPPCYKTTWGDNEIGARVRRAGQFTWCEAAVVEHFHHGNQKAEMDKGYRMVVRHELQDRATFHKRAAVGFPDDFEPVVKPCTSKP